MIFDETEKGYKMCFDLARTLFRFASFGLFRRSISDIEIITFDELFERANAIVLNNGRIIK